MLGTHFLISVVPSTTASNVMNSSSGVHKYYINKFSTRIIQIIRLKLSHLIAEGHIDVTAKLFYGMMLHILIQKIGITCTGMFLSLLNENS